ncbi:pyrroline-5-carboxylate reductase [Acinetobacter seifertii]|nr:pyrroline-5-carboxylate reductase [Acinetobacter seifertii]QNX51225.1 pyrroline-5-carboxylate reductase [Acinetobacter seifertii]QNX82676.1 pyrroline-5-carboxylate reductase [Acinetobacter seifertii]
MLNIVQPNICFIGSSNLSLALIGGLVLKGFLIPNNINI